jgi:hypothetical protein
VVVRCFSLPVFILAYASVFLSSVSCDFCIPCRPPLCPRFLAWQSRWVVGKQGILISLHHFILLLVHSLGASHGLQATPALTMYHTLDNAPYTRIGTRTHTDDCTHLVCRTGCRQHTNSSSLIAKHDLSNTMMQRSGMRSELTSAA